MSNSPPSKVKSDDVKVLASGIDSLVLSFDIFWKDEKFFEKLNQAKEKAESVRQNQMVEITPKENAQIALIFDIPPYGGNGYRWILLNKHFTVKMGDWVEPCSRPSAVVEIRSEALHYFGVEDSVAIIIHALTSQNAMISKIRASRADLYCDILIPEKYWYPDLEENFVTRADITDSHKRSKRFSGVSIGRGEIMARLYDKPLEIKTKSKKFWMYKIWGLKEVPTGFKIIRVEFQLRREKLKELGINSFQDLMEKQTNLWAYCTEKWFKLQSKGKHHTQRKTLDWWKHIQNGYKDSQNAISLVCVKSSENDIKQLTSQIVGCFESVIAIQSNGIKPKLDDVIAYYYWLKKGIPSIESSPEDLLEGINKKMAIKSNSAMAFYEAIQNRKSISSDLRNFRKNELIKESETFNRKLLYQ